MPALVRKQKHLYRTIQNPRNLNYFWNFGVLSGLMLVVQIVTGIVMAMHYHADAAGAFNSVEHIMRDVNAGWMLRYAHANGASFFFIAVYIHIFRGLFYGSYKAPRELVWRCLTEPAELAQFWGPAGMSTPVDGIVVDLRPGGRFETLMVGEHGSHRMVATFTEVLAPSRLCWVDPASGVETTGTLTALADGTTEVVIRQRHVPEAMRSPEAQAGFLSSLDKLEAHLARLLQGEPT